MKCVAITTKGEQCKKNAKIDDLCTDHYKKINGTSRLLKHEGETKPCSSSLHTISVSRYPKTDVPIEYFKKEKGEGLYSTCIDCRTSRNGTRVRSKKPPTETETHAKCQSDHHGVEGVSEYPKDKVPIELFRKDDGKMSADCSDCRKYANVRRQQKRKEKLEKAQKDDKHMCLHCNNIFLPQEMALNKNGKISTSCKKCKKKEKIYKFKLTIYLL